MVRTIHLSVPMRFGLSEPVPVRVSHEDQQPSIEVMERAKCVVAGAKRRQLDFVILSTGSNICHFGDDVMPMSKLTGRDGFIRAKLEKGYSFRLLSKELGVSHQALINYVKGSGKHRAKKRAGISFRKPSTTRDFTETHGVSIDAVRGWLRRGRIKGRKVGHRWVILE